MWQAAEDAIAFAERHRLSLASAQTLRCTAEHMQARQDGGMHDPCNIVAACRRCNLARHQSALPLNPLQYRQHVANEVAEGTWHLPEIQNAFASVTGLADVGPSPTFGD